MPSRRPSQIRVQNHTATKKGKKENNQALKRIQNRKNRKLNDARGTRLKIKVNRKRVNARLQLKPVRSWCERIVLLRLKWCVRVGDREKLIYASVRFFFFSKIPMTAVDHAQAHIGQPADTSTQNALPSESVPLIVSVKFDWCPLDRLIEPQCPSIARIAAAVFAPCPNFEKLCVIDVRRIKGVVVFILADRR